MPTDIGPRIGLDGEKEFRQSLKAVDQQLKAMGAELRSVSSAFDDNADSEEALRAQNQVLAKSIEATEQKAKLLTSQLERQQGRLSDLGAELDRVTQEYGANSREASAAQNAYNRQYIEVARLETQLNNTTDSLNRMRSQVAANERAMEGLDDALDEAGDSADTSSGKFDALAVAAGNLISSGIEAAANAVMDLVSSLWNLDEATEEYRQAQGRLNTAYEAAGYGAETAQEAYRGFYAILGDTDTATEASQLLAQLAERAEDVSTWTRIAAGVNGTFGDSLPIEGLIEASNETAKVGQVTGVLADALNWVGISEDEFNARLEACSTESERNRIIMQTLSAQYDEAADAFYRNNDALISSRDAQAQLDDVTAKLGDTIANTKAELTGQFLPAVSGLAGAFNDILTSAPRASEAFADAITNLVATGAQMLPSILTTGTQIMGALVSGIAGALPNVISTLGTGLMNGVPQLTTTISSVMGMIAAYLTENFPTILQTGLDFLVNFTTMIRENAGMLVDGALSMISALAQGIADGIPTLVENIPTIVSNIANVINDNAPKIVETGIGIILSLIEGLVKAIPTIVENIPEIIGAIVDTLLAFNWVNLGTSVVKGLSNGLKSAVSFVKDAAASITNTIKTNISQLPQQMLTIGKNIVQGLWNGIKSMASWIKNQISGFIGGIVSSVKGLLGIHSPSTVFAGMGENMALGLGQGFAGEMRDVQRQINRSMEGLAAPSMPYGVTAAAAPAYSGSQQSMGAEAIAAAVRAALDGAAVYLNGQRVGSLVTRQQNNATIARGQSQVYI